MSRAVFNKAMDEWGTSTWVLSTSEMDVRRNKTVLEVIRDLCLNLIIKLKELIALKQTVDKPLVSTSNEVYNEVKDSMKPLKEKFPESLMPSNLDKFCEAISIFEGGEGDLNHRNNNAGNLKNLNGTFMRFNSLEEGMQALRAYVIRACTGKHKLYNPMMTLYDFFSVYAPASDKNQPRKYAEWVAKRVGVLPTMQIKYLM